MGVEGLSFRTEEVQGLKHQSCLDVFGSCVASSCGFGAFGGFRIPGLSEAIVS